MNNLHLKPHHLSKIEIIFHSLKHFAITSDLRMVFQAFLLLVTFLKVYLFHKLKISGKDLQQNYHIHSFPSYYIFLATGESIRAGLNFFSDFVFERFLSFYGGSLAVRILNNIYSSDSKDIFEIPGHEFENKVNEGTKAMAKVCRFMLLRLSSKLFYLFFDLKTVWLQDYTPDKTIFKISILFTVLIIIFQNIQSNRISELNKRNMKISFEKEALILENLENAVIVKSYQSEGHRRYLFDRCAYQWDGSNVATGLSKMKFDIFYYIASATSRPWLAGYFFSLVCSSVPDNAFNLRPMLDSLGELYRTVENLVEIVRATISSIEMARDVIPYIEMPPESKCDQIKIHSFTDFISFNSIYYSAKDKLVIQDASFDIIKGKKYAIYGKNGTGKSSVAKILMGFEDYKGDILIDGVSFKQIDMASYRSLITYVPQDTKLFNETIFFNLSFGNNKNYEHIIEEAKRMNIHDEVMLFPNGYNTIVGEDGQNLNGGLRQKIFYTRAFLRDSEIYVFDEPSNNLDQKHSRFLLDYLEDPRFSSKTFIVICHDPDLVKCFPAVYKFIDGKVILEKDI